MTAEDDQTVASCGFWLEGVLLVSWNTFSYFLLVLLLQPSVGLCGLAFNTISALVLNSPLMKNSFNKLLLSLLVFDSVFIFFIVLDFAAIRGATLSSFQLIA